MSASPSRMKLIRDQYVLVCSESSLSCVLNHITLSTFYFEGVTLSVFLRGSFGREDRVRTKTGAQEVEHLVTRAMAGGWRLSAALLLSEFCVKELLKKLPGSRACVLCMTKGKVFLCGECPCDCERSTPRVRLRHSVSSQPLTAFTVFT